MLRPIHRPPSSSLAWALALSLLLHGLALWIHKPDLEMRPHDRPAQARLSATLMTRPAPQPPQPEPSQNPPPQAKTPPSRSRILTAENGKRRSSEPERRWSAAEKAEMDRFLDDIAAEAKARPKPTLAQKALKMAAEAGVELAQKDEQGRALLELKPNAPPPDPFSLSMYVDGVIRRLNRSSNFVSRNPRAQGVKAAAIQFRINPDGSLRAFEVLNAGDQAGQIAFIKEVVERSIPFAPFPPDVDRAARSLAMTICIQPNAHGDGLGFRRLDARSC